MSKVMCTLGVPLFSGMTRSVLMCRLPVSNWFNQGRAVVETSVSYPINATFVRLWLWKGGCDNRHYVDYKRSCFAKNCTGAHGAHGNPHGQDWRNWAWICGAATVSSPFRGRFQGDGF